MANTPINNNGPRSITGITGVEPTANAAATQVASKIRELLTPQAITEAAREVTKDRPLAVVLANRLGTMLKLDDAAKSQFAGVVASLVGDIRLATGISEGREQAAVADLSTRTV